MPLIGCQRPRARCTRTNRSDFLFKGSEDYVWALLENVINATQSKGSASGANLQESAPVSRVFLSLLKV